MGLHSGEGTLGGDNYIGLDVHRAARIAATAHGGQVILSETTQALTTGKLPAGTHLRDLGLHRLKDLAESYRLFQLVIDGLRSEFPPLRTLDVSLHKLPTQLTSFVGRRQEVSEVRDLLQSGRLLTLTGPGGTGKTRLALQTAAESAADYPDGVFFVTLAPITDAGLVPAAVASVLGLQQTTADPDQQLSEYLAGKRMLLVLDNFEQLLPAASKVAGWLQAASRLSVLVTSQALLRISGERVYPVPPLGLPEPDTLPTPETLLAREAVALFVERAMGVRPDFRLTLDNANEVAEIVTRLDGMPLAIELAAARVRVLTPAALLTRLASRLGLLTGGSRDLPARQQTLRNAIAWSHDLLDQPTQTLFARLAVFVGGAGLTEAEAVCGPAAELGLEVLDGLDALVGNSLIRRVESAEEIRFWMLETIREFAIERLGELPEVDEIRRRHTAVFTAMAEEAAPRLVEESARQNLDRLEADLDNLRAVLNRAIDGADSETAYRLLGSLWRYWQMRGHIHEGRDMVSGILSLSGASPSARLRALEGAGGLAYWEGDMPAALSVYEEALVIARGMGDEREIARALYNLGFPTALSGNWEVVRPEGFKLMEESLAIGRRLGDPSTIGNALWGIGILYISKSEPINAQRYFDEALAMFTQTTDRFMLGWSYRLGGVCRLAAGDLEGARSLLELGLRIFLDAADVSGLALHIRDFAALALARGEDERALRLAGAMANLQTVSEMRLLEIVVNQLEGIDAASARLGEEHAQKLIAEGRAMSLSEAVAYALEDDQGTQSG
jgi:predicted ATPase